MLSVVMLVLRSSEGSTMQWLAVKTASSIKLWKQWGG